MAGYHPLAFLRRIYIYRVPDANGKAKKDVRVSYRERTGTQRCGKKRKRRDKSSVNIDSPRGTYTKLEGMYLNIASIDVVC